MVGKWVKLCPLCANAQGPCPAVLGSLSFPPQSQEPPLYLVLLSLYQPPWSFPICDKAASVFQSPSVSTVWICYRALCHIPGPTTEPLSFMEFSGLCRILLGRGIILARFPRAPPDFPVIFRIVILVLLGFAVCNINTVWCWSDAPAHPWDSSPPSLSWAEVQAQLPCSPPVPCSVQASLLLSPHPISHREFPTQAKGKRCSRFELGPASVSQPPTLSSTLKISGGS